MPKTLEDVGEDLACNADSLVWQATDIARLIADMEVPRDLQTELIALADKLVYLSDEMSLWAVRCQMIATARDAEEVASVARAQAAFYAGREGA